MDFWPCVQPLPWSFQAIVDIRFVARGLGFQIWNLQPALPRFLRLVHQNVKKRGFPSAYFLSKTAISRLGGGLRRPNLVISLAPHRVVFMPCRHETLKTSFSRFLLDAQLCGPVTQRQEAAGKFRKRHRSSADV